MDYLEGRDLPTSCLLYSMSRCFALVHGAFGCAQCLMVRCPVKELRHPTCRKKKKNIHLHRAASCGILLVVTPSSRLDSDGVTHSVVSISPTTFVFHSLFVRSPETLCPEHGSQKRPFPSYIVSCVGHSRECCKRRVWFFSPEKNVSG